MIISSWPTFRHHFSPRVASGAINCTFVVIGVNGLPAIVRTAAGSFATDGFAAGMSVDVGGTVDNNLRFTVEAVTTSGGAPNDQLDLAADSTITAEVCFTTALEGVYVDGDGVETWPIALVRADGSGFGDAGSTITGVPDGTAYDGTTFEISCNAGAADAVAGADEYDWYLSQRTDEVASQYLSMAVKPTAGGLSYSGSVRIAYTALASAHFTFGVDVDTATLRALFRAAHLYVRRRSDGAIQWVDLLAEMTGQ